MTIPIRRCIFVEEVPLLTSILVRFSPPTLQILDVSLFRKPFPLSKPHYHVKQNTDLGVESKV